MSRIGDQSKLDIGLRHSFHCFNDLGLGIGNQIILMISFLSHCNQNLMILFLHFLIRKQCLEIIKKVQKLKLFKKEKKMPKM